MLREFVSQDKACPNCGCQKFLRFKAKAADSNESVFVNIIECRHCHFAWQYPLGRSKKESIEFFEKAYLGQGQVTSNYFNPDRKREIAELELRFVEEAVQLKGSILDVGAGAGIFAVTAAENGWTVTAIDPALEIGGLSDKKNVTFIKGTLNDIPNKELFDVITMWDIIEHVENPLELILSVRKFLKPGGWLILETGNYKSAQRVFDGLSYWIYQLDHKWYFSPDNIKVLLRRAGFSELLFSRQVLRPNWSGAVDFERFSFLNLMQSIFSSPAQIKAHILRYIKLLKVQSWEMSNIPIVALAAKRAL